MSLLLWSLFVAALLSVLSKGPAMRILSQQTQGYDNHHPRAQQAGLTGMGARALAAHQNTLENFPLFAAGVLVAEFGAAAHPVTAILAVGYLILRVLYIRLYLSNRASARTLVWALAYLACLGLLLAPWYAT